MRVVVVAFLAAFAGGPPLADASLAVSIDARPIARSCSIASTGTIVAFDAGTTGIVTYRFVHSDGTFSTTGRLAFDGDGAVAQSVRDTWTPHGPAPWVALEVLAPHHVRSARVPLTPCRAAITAAR
jgi:hypothetical protein